MLERNTIISSNVIRILKESAHPLSVSHVMESLARKDLNPNKATIYRILKKLIHKNELTEITVRNGASYFELKKDHHHHFICNQCETAFCLDGCHVHAQNIDVSRLLPTKKFKIESHDFNVYGICEACT